MSRLPLTAALLLTALAAVPSAAQAADLWVDGANPMCSDARPASAVGSASTPWCTLGRATSQAVAGDTVRVLPATYRETVRFDRSGTASAPIRVEGAAAGGVVDAGGAAQALKVMDASDVQLANLRVTGATSQGIWAQGAARVRLDTLQVTGNPGTGVTLKGTTSTTITASTVADNGSAGVLELAGTRDARYTDNIVRANGRGSATYNGDGIQLGGTGAIVSGNVITDNGGTTYEHGIYTGAASSGWTIERNTVTTSAGANVKAAGGPGVVRRNRLTDGRYGLILSDNTAPVTVEHNVIDGIAQHLVFLTSGTTAAQARLLANTVVQTGRATTSGDASAVFVNAATSLELRDNLFSYAGTDNFGVALWVNDPARLGSLVSETNWLTARDAQSRHLAWAGSRTTLTGWRTSSGEDARSLSSWAPDFDLDRRVTSTNWGRDRGDALGLTEDFVGAPLPTTGPVDIGAYEGP